MIITYLGGESVKVQFGDTVLAFNPISKESSLKSSKYGADIVLSTINHQDMNGLEAVTFGDKKPFLVNGPGEYEIKGVFIKGLPSETGYDNEKRINTVYSVTLENMNICFLGAVNTPELPKDTDEAIDDVDILFVPIGGSGVLSPSDAYKLAVSIGPKIIIPIHYGNIGDKDALKTFLREAGESPKPETKLTLKKKDLEGKDAEVMVLAEE
ncbi:MAG: MBL fold metallo-hydrolase [Candidatus Paceibacterota bacterium]|jgi:L-ascorbate metabolism protein UlaG (beta-lactamase superfamily)